MRHKWLYDWGVACKYTVTASRRAIFFLQGKMYKMQENQVSRKGQMILGHVIIYVFLRNCYVPKCKLLSRGFADW